MKIRNSTCDEPRLPPPGIGDTRTIVASVEPPLAEALPRNACPLYFEVIDSYGAGITSESRPIEFPLSQGSRPALPSCSASATRRGRVHVSKVEQALQAVSLRLADAYSPSEFQGILNGLTTREWDVLLGMLSGQSCKQISHTLQIGFQTVAKHKSHLFQKLHIKSVAELVTLLWSMVIVDDLPGHFASDSHHPN